MKGVEEREHSTLQNPVFLSAAGMIKEGFTEEVSFALAFEGQPRAQCFGIGRKQENRERRPGHGNGPARL